MNCRDCSDFLSDYLDGELAQEVSATFERHLQACPNCVSYVEQFRATILAGRRACEGDGSNEADVPEELIRAILAARRT